mmetsp:Transcript_24347/g.59607  ORF Transcript_24347/g.59607 Transcript_24347/m.59607 type:complete len:217 (+) Transcript_24347:84-734(+)
MFPTTTRSAFRLATSLRARTNYNAWNRCSIAAFSATAAFPEPNNNSATDTDLMDSFQTLGVSRRFGLQQSELKLKYHTLMNEYHPDKHQDKSLEERLLIDEKAASITHAFQTLSHPSLRAKHLLTLLGNPIEETSKTDLVGMDFLLQVMELQESVEAAPAENMEPLWKETQIHIGSLLDELTVAFDETRDETTAKYNVAKLQYWYRIESLIHEKMR